MRVTRTDIATEAHSLWKSLKGGRYEMSRADAYREKINELFTNYAFPGGYPILFTTDDSDCLCADCAKKTFLEDRIDITCGTYDEGPSMYCDDCNVEIESAYGDTNEQEEN